MRSPSFQGSSPVRVATSSSSSRRSTDPASEVSAAKTVSSSLRPGRLIASTFASREPSQAATGSSNPDPTASLSHGRRDSTSSHRSATIPVPGSSSPAAAEASAQRTMLIGRS